MIALDSVHLLQQPLMPIISKEKIPIYIMIVFTRHLEDRVIT
jgi:hypothetical protein